jgi:hypothetical protein
MAVKYDNSNPAYEFDKKMVVIPTKWVVSFARVSRIYTQPTPKNF